MNDRTLVSFSDGTHELKGSWHFPEEDNPPLVILATGDGPNGSEGLTWKNITPMLTGAGMAVFLFDFTGLGHSEGQRQELTLSLGIKNFSGVMSYVRRSDGFDRSRVGVLGASYGANIALLEAWKYPEIVAIGLKSPCCILAEAYQSEYGAEVVRAWGEAGYLEETQMNYQALLDSLMHNTYVEAAKSNAATRIVHGTADSAVPIRQSRDLQRVMKDATLLEIEGADHWYAEDDQWERMAEDLRRFMSSQLVSR